MILSAPPVGCDQVSSLWRRGSFLCLGRRSSRVRLSSNFLVGRMGALSRGLSSSFLIVVLTGFLATPTRVLSLRAFDSEGLTHDFTLFDLMNRMRTGRRA